MVQVYILNVKNLPDALEYPKCMEQLPAERKEKIIRIRRTKERKLSLGAGLLLEYAKKQYPNWNGLHFNLSHSGEYALCAVADKAVGCDLEQIGDAPLKVAHRYFCKNEVDYLESLNKDMRNEEFYRIWTIKESYVKMLKRGIGMGLGSFEVCFSTEVQIKKEEKVQPCYIKEYKLDKYKVSVCSEDNIFEEELIEVLL